LRNDYPLLNNYINSKTKLFFYYINSSVGLSGIIVCFAHTDTKMEDDNVLLHL